MSNTHYNMTVQGRSREAERIWAEIFAEPDDRARQDRLRRNLRRAIARELTPRQQQILELHYGQGLPVNTLARMLGVAPSTVSRTLRRAQDRLRHYLEYSL